MFKKVFYFYIIHDYTVIRRRRMPTGHIGSPDDIVTPF